MTTERLYFADAEQLAFNAAVLAVRNEAGRSFVALDCSAFYPEGGGQPADHGRLGQAVIDDVQVDDDGVVWHRLAAGASAPDVGSTVSGTVDAERRRDHMQQHCGQHILTAAFIATGGLTTTSFHLSGQSVTIDLATAAVSEQQLRAAEAWANARIRANLAIHARFVTDEELAQLALRKAPTVQGAVRVVSIGDIDHSACGGTHPTHSGGVGGIAVLGWEKQRGQARVSFACGERLVRLIAQQRNTLQTAAGLLKVGQDELAAAIERLQTRQQELAEQLSALELAYDGITAQQLAGRAALRNGRPVVVAELPPITAARLRRIAGQAAAAAGALTVLTTTAGDQQRIVIAGGAAGRGDARSLLQAYLAVGGGRGGGSAQLAEGGGPMERAAAALQALLAELDAAPAAG